MAFYVQMRNLWRDDASSAELVNVSHEHMDTQMTYLLSLSFYCLFL